MKQNILHKLWIVALLLMAGCKQGELPDAAMEELPPLSISVTDGGYVAEGIKTETAARAVENNYRKDFTAGDECGLYIVRDGKIVAENVKLVAEDGDNGISWRTANGTSLAGGLPDEVYFLYYPYKQEITGKVDASADNDAAFFEKLISTWTVSSDQSDYASGYSASDLMTASGTVKETGDVLSLSFTMKHRMSLVVIEVPLTIYHFTDFPDITYSEGASNVDFKGNFKPCAYNGAYRYLFNPFSSSDVVLTYFDERNEELPINLSGSTNGEPSINISGGTISGGYFRTIRIDGGIQERTCTYAESGVTRIGDFYCTKDGGKTGYLMPKEADSETLQPVNVVGIVFQTDRKRIGLKEKSTLAEKGVDEPHGLVMALKNAAEGKYWSRLRNNETIMDCTTRAKIYRDINGYGNYFNTYASVSNYDDYPAFKEAVNYINTCPVPENTTGWYLPSSGQWWDITQNLGGNEFLASEDEQNSQQKGALWNFNSVSVTSNLNKMIEAVGNEKKDIFEESEFFWTSSEYDTENARYWYIAGTYTYSNSMDKLTTESINGEIHVRPVLAF